MSFIKQKLRRLLQETLSEVQLLPVSQRPRGVRERLNAIQAYCTSVEKTFIVVELEITCDQYDLGGSEHQTATLFRGPSPDASVAICVTEQGSVLHRNDSPWRLYCDAGDVNPIQPAVPTLAA